MCPAGHRVFQPWGYPMGFQYDEGVDEVSGSVSGARKGDVFRGFPAGWPVSQATEEEPGDEHEGHDGHRHDAPAEWNRITDEHAGDGRCRQGAGGQSERGEHLRDERKPEKDDEEEKDRAVGDRQVRVMGRDPVRPADGSKRLEEIRRGAGLGKLHAEREQVSQPDGVRHQGCKAGEGQPDVRECESLAVPSDNRERRQRCDDGHGAEHEREEHPQPDGRGAGSGVREKIAGRRGPHPAEIDGW